MARPLFFAITLFLIGALLRDAAPGLSSVLATVAAGVILLTALALAVQPIAGGAR